MEKTALTVPVKIKNLNLGEGIPAVCVPLTAPDPALLSSQAAGAVLAGADLVEWRADFIPFLNPEMIPAILTELTGTLAGRIPLLFTVRTQAEGGEFQGDFTAYRACNLAAAAAGQADLIDIEALSRDAGPAGPGCTQDVMADSGHKGYDPETDPANPPFLTVPAEKRELIKAVQSYGVKVIASSHDFGKTDPAPMLMEKLRLLMESGADIVKLAVMPVRPGDPQVLMDTVQEARQTFLDRPVIAMSMGEPGRPTRILGERFGSCVTFGTAGAASAPGQIPVKELREAMSKARL